MRDMELTVYVLDELYSIFFVNEQPPRVSVDAESTGDEAQGNCVAQ